jgi:sigma-B regulation protein RsbQ
MKSAIQTKNNVTVLGNPNAEQTLIFAHGFGSDQQSWKAVIPAFESDYKIVIFDNVGAGKADPEAYNAINYDSLDAYADDLLDIFEHFNLKGSIVIAHSVSSMITLIAALKSPDYFSKVVFIGASPRYIDDESQNYTGGFTQPALNQMYEAMNSNYHAWASGFSAVAMGNPESPELGEEFARTLSAIRPDIALSVAKVIFESDVRDRLNLLNLEVLLIQSQDDIAVPATVASYLNENIKGSILKYVNAKGHFPHVSAPLEIIKVIKDFI